MRQFDDIDQTDIPLTAFDATDIVPVQVCALRKVLLREPALLPQVSQALPENGPRIWFRLLASVSSSGILQRQASSGEIHPVTAIEVLDGGQWKEIDTQ